MERFISTVTSFVFGFIAICLISLLVGLPVMFIWNWIMPALFGLPLITFWQSVGLYLLASVLFKSNDK
jgi:hypothetical protein